MHRLNLYPEDIAIVLSAGACCDTGLTHGATVEIGRASALGAYYMFLAVQVFASCK